MTAIFRLLDWLDNLNSSRNAACIDRMLQHFAQLSLEQLKYFL